jgi:SAM-dependent methyltransferase
MWESPKYRFRVPVDPDDDGHGQLKEVVFDVTGSAPSFESPGKRLGGALKKLIALFPNQKAIRVLDLGAGKLRNTVHILKERPSSHVWVVEYESLRETSAQARTFYKAATGFKSRFHDMSFPHNFVQNSEAFDLILLINVISVMPIPEERLFLLKYCFDRLVPGGRLFWYSQHGEPDYAIGGDRCNDKTRCGDGFHIGGKKYEKTFFREFGVNEIDEMMLAAGFTCETYFTVERNLARVYKKRPPAVLAGLLDKSRIEPVSKPGWILPIRRDPHAR